MEVCGGDGISAQNAHSCPDGNGDEGRYVKSIFSQDSRYEFQFFKTNRN